MPNLKISLCPLLAITILIPFVSYADEVNKENRRYKTLEERRDAGKKHQITQWLEVSPLIELEYNRQRFIPVDSAVSETSISESDKTLQLEIIIDPAEWVNFEIVYEYDDRLGELYIDEAVAEFEVGDFKLEVGRFTVPFGEYYSRFVTDPLLKFGETDARSLAFAWEPDDGFEATLFVLKSKLEKTGETGDNLDWGLSLNISPAESVLTGISYLSDLSESDEQLLEDEIVYQQRVGAFSAYVNVEIGQYDISVEFVQALEHFAELEVGANRPNAWNIELGIYPEGRYELAFRLEGSDELEDTPELQTGLGMTWHFHKQVYLTAEYLLGRYKKAFVENDLDEVLDYQKQFAAQFVVSF